MLTQEEERLLSLVKPIQGDDWLKLRAFWKRTFGREYGSKCRCNAHNLISKLRIKFGYVQQG